MRDFIPRLSGTEADTKASALARVCDKVAQFLRRTRASEVGYESNIDTFTAMGATLQHAIQRHRLEPGVDPAYPDGWNCSVVGVHSTQLKATQLGEVVHGSSKEARTVGGIEPLLSTHRIIVDPSVVVPESGKDIHYAFQFQLSRMTTERGCVPRNDRADCLACNLLFCEQQEAALINPDSAGRAAVERWARKKARTAARQRGQIDRSGWNRYG